MIQLECSNCKAQLAIDDAFAGGVCRCQQCGTIQTVPKPGEKASAVGETPKALFKRKARIESALNPYSDALDRAADDMDSSGGLSANALANAGLRRSSSPVGDDPSPSGHSDHSKPVGKSAAAVAAAPAKAQKKQASQAKTASPAAAAGGFVTTPSKAALVVNPTGKKKTSLIAAIVGGALVLALGGLLVVNATGDGANNGREVETALAATEEGTICGIPLRGSAVVFVLDRSGMTQQAFADMSRMSLKAVESLGSSRKFQIVVWNNHQPLAIPSTGPESPSLTGIEEARKALAGTYAGSSDLADHLKTAAADGAEDVVILSAVDADQQLADEVSEALSGTKLRLHAVAIGSDLTGDQMRLITQASGGQFRQVALESLQ